MGDKYTKHKHFKMFQSLINSAKLLAIKDKCFMAHTEYFLEDLVFLEHLEILKLNMKSLAENQELSVQYLKYLSSVLMKTNKIL